MFTLPSGRPSRRQVLLRWAGALALTGLAFALDGPVDRALLIRDNRALAQFAWDCSKVGEWWCLGLAGFALAALLIRLRRLEAARSVLFTVLTGGITGLAATVIRTLTGRTRPNNVEVPQGFYGIWHQGHWILGRPAFSSFPSGHSATVAGLAMAAWLVDRRAGAVAWVFALLVIWSRLAQNCHHLSDVVAATLLGIAGAKLIHRWLPPLLCVWTEPFRR